MPRFKDALSDAISRASERSGLQGKDLAERIGVHPVAFSGWKNGVKGKKIGAAKLDRIAEEAALDEDERFALNVLWAKDRLCKNSTGRTLVELFEEVAAGGKLSAKRQRAMEESLVELARERAQTG